ATPPVVIFPRSADRELAAGAAYRHHRADLERRLRDRFPRYARQPAGRVLYVAYDDALAALGVHTDARSGQMSPAARGE
ncbi:MAG TPA: hypothetical protein VFW96_07910, partial [Thermomicrobiales bacterium]|nr:hypothetical protein [Thermomicrobiales bacterium]